MTNASRFARWIVAATIGTLLLVGIVPMCQTYKRRSELLQRDESGTRCSYFSPFARRANHFWTRPMVPRLIHDWVGSDRVRPLEPLARATLSLDFDDDIRILLPETELSQICVVGDGNHCSDKLLRHLTHLPRLVELQVCNVPITKEGVELLSRFPSLKSLFVECSAAPSPGLEQLSQLAEIDELGLMDERCPISEEVCRQIAAMPKLRSLRWGTSWPTSASFEALTRSATIEHIAFFRQRDRLTLERAKQLAGMKAIKSIDFSGEINSEAEDFLKEAGLLVEEVLLGLPRT
ncbi:MAG: hypothetical protein IAG10_14285 [Planctomycetaceae bacterium]|nr:hypothetical protein [Planctomycetaceae bacterium]